MANRSRSRSRKSKKSKQKQSSPALTPSYSETPARAKMGGRTSAYAVKLKSVPNTTQTNAHKTCNGAKTQNVKKRKVLHNLKEEMKDSESFHVHAGRASVNSGVSSSSSTHQTKRLEKTPGKQKMLKRKRNTHESKKGIKRSRSDTRHNKRSNDKIAEITDSQEVRSRSLLCNNARDEFEPEVLHCSGDEKKRKKMLKYDKKKLSVINKQSDVHPGKNKKKKSKKRTAHEAKLGPLVSSDVVDDVCLHVSGGEEIDFDTTIEDDDTCIDNSIVAEDINNDNVDDSVVVCIDDGICTRPDSVSSDPADSALVLNTTCGSQILVLPAEQEINVQGKCRAITLCGTTSVLGYTLKKDTFYDVFSPDSNSLLTFKSVHYETNEKTVQTLYKKLANDLEDHDVDRLYSFRTKNVTVVKLENFYSGRYDYITTLTPYQQLFGVWVHRSDPSKSKEQTAYKTFNLGPGNTSTSVMDTNSYTYKRAQLIWSQALKKDNWQNGEAPCIVLCGARNSGKSTLSRYLVNSTLNELDSVMFLECDVGQTEFTPPGCVSLHRVTEPVLGPPFCHQRKPEYACFYGDVAVNNDPDHYIHCIQECFNYYASERKKTPLIINTCGWITGFGLDLLVDIVRLARPNIVIQMQINKKGRKNLNPPPVTTDMVRIHQSWLDQQMVENKHRPTNHKLFVLNSYLDNFQHELQSGSINRKYRPVEHRDLSLLSYLAMNFDHGMTLSADIPKRVPWHKIGIHVCHERVSQENILAAVNASIVALCSTDLMQAKRDCEDSCWTFQSLPVCRYLGFGLVRGIDMEKKELYIVTPLLVNELSEVNLLVKGAINIPDQVLLSQKHGDKLPYVDDTVLSTGATSLVQRRHMPRKL